MINKIYINWQWWNIRIKLQASALWEEEEGSKKITKSIKQIKLIYNIRYGWIGNLILLFGRYLSSFQFCCFHIISSDFCHSHSFWLLVDKLLRHLIFLNNLVSNRTLVNSRNNFNQQLANRNKVNKNRYLNSPRQCKNNLWTLIEKKMRRKM